MRLFDSHAHYFDDRFDGIADEILKNEVFGGKVEKVINVGTNNENNIVCLRQAENYDGMYAACGIHPEDARYLEGTPDEELATLESLIAKETAKPKGERKLVALGEIGFDFHYEGYSRELQELYFERQMELAKKYGLPVIIHDRDAHGPCFDMALKFPEIRGVFHSFSGSAEMAKELVRRGWYISFSGVLTFKNAARVRAVAESVPLERVLIETDAPYLAPHPHRGQLNHSGLMEFTARTLAEVKGITPDEAAEITYTNVSELFGI